MIMYVIRTTAISVLFHSVRLVNKIRLFILYPMGSERHRL